MSKKKGGKGKSMPSSFKQKRKIFDEAHEDVQVLKGNYEDQNQIQNINENELIVQQDFEPSQISKFRPNEYKTKDFNTEYSDLEDVGKRKTNPQLKLKVRQPQQRQLKTLSPIKPVVVLNRDHLFTSLDSKDYYPLNKIQDVVKQLKSNSEVHLNYSGVQQVTDAVFVMLLTLKDDRFDCVTQINLAGCHHITDRGVFWLTLCFKNLNTLNLLGCVKVTECCLNAVMLNCKSMTNLTVSGTSIRVLPPWFGSYVDLNASYLPLASPELDRYEKSKQVILKDESYFKKKDSTLYKVIIIRRSSVLTSLLRLIHKEKDFSIKEQVTSDLAYKFNQNSMVFIECPDTVTHLFSSRRTCFVFPYQLSDKSKIKQEAMNIAGLICELTAQTWPSQNTFTLIGLNSSSVGVVPADVLKDEVHRILKQTMKHLDVKLTELTDVKKDRAAGYNDQENLSATKALMSGIADISLTSVEVNMDGKDIQKEVNVILEDLVYQMSVLQTKSPVTAEYSKTLHEFCLSSDPVKSDVSSLDSAIQALSFSKNRLVNYGALNFLHMMGKVCFIRGSDDSNVSHVVKTKWLTQALSVLLTVPDSSLNNGTVPYIGDETPVWSAVQLDKAFQQHGLNGSSEATAALNCLVNITEVLLPGKTFTSLSHISEKPPISLDKFISEKTNDVCEKVTYTYLLSHLLPVPMMHQVLTSCLKVHQPIMLWSNGCVFLDGIVEVLIHLIPSKTENSIVMLHAQTIKTDTSSVTHLLWNSVEQYKIILDACFTKAGISTQVVCEHGLPKPDSITGLTRAHKFLPGFLDESSCQTCTITARACRFLQESKSVIAPIYLNSEAARFDPESCGKVNGTDVVLNLTGFCHVTTGMSACENNQVAVTVISMPTEPAVCIIGLESMGSNTVNYTLSEGKLEVKGNDLKTEVPRITSAGAVIVFRLCPMKDKVTVQLEVSVGGSPVATLPIPNSTYKLTIGVDAVQLGDQFIVALHSTNLLPAVPSLQPKMRLEALDRLNPSLVAVATIEEIRESTGEILIHFDGWTSRYDYWTSPTSSDLHPLGYMSFVGHKYNKYNPRLQEPKNYGKKFKWPEYLKDLNQPPVPWELFSEEQKEGTPPDETSRAQEILQVSYDVSQSTSMFCSVNKNRGAALEKHVKQTLSESLNEDGKELSEFLNNSSTPICLFPKLLDISYLRYPTMSAMFNPSMQHMHFLCPGQRHDYHLVNHEGVNMAKVSKTYVGMESVMSKFHQALYLQEYILPTVLSKFCQGIENISPTQLKLVELGVRRLLRLYVMMFEFLAMAHMQAKISPSERRQKSEKDSMTLAVQEEKVLKTQLANILKDLKDESFLNAFNTSKYLQCQGHHASICPGHDLTEIVLTPFTGVFHLITKVDFQNNSLTFLPNDFFQNCFAIIEVFLSRNSLESMPSLSGCSSLIHLDVSHNHLKTFPNDLNSTKDSLKTLILSDNPLCRLPAVVMECTQLEDLQADNIGLIPSLMDVCEKLKALKKLSLNYNKIEKWPAKFSDGLVDLGLAGVPFVQISDVSSSLSVVNFNSFISSNVMLEQIPEKNRLELYSPGSKNDPLTVVTSVKLQELNARLAKQNVYSQLGTGNLSGGKDFPSGFPASLFPCKSLEKLNLSNHAIEKIPDEIEALKSLQVLDLSHNHHLESVTAELATLPLREIHLKDCPLLKTPPKEIIARGFSTIYGYLRRLRMGSVPCKRTKLMMVGLGGAGKTSLVRALTNTEFQAFFDYSEEITDGIDISEWKVPVEDSTEPIVYSVWDFAGQTVYYNTHQFFLSNRAVYLLLWNIRLGYEHAGLNFWLSSIACHAPLAPILVVGTHCDKVEKSRLPTEELQQRFPQITCFHFVSSYSGEGVPELLKDITKVTLEQKYMGEQIPEAWLNLEKRLLKHREEKKDLLPWKEVEREASACGLIENTEIYQGVQFLHDLGSVQFFNTDFLRSQVVIYPQWIVDVMACVVTVHVGPIQNGKLLHGDMAKVWNAYPAYLHPWLLRLTEEFDLTFPLEDENANIVPCLLPTIEPKYTWSTADKEKGFRDTKMIYVFDYLPAGLFNRAQVRLHKFSSSSLMWKKGSLLEKNNHKALLLQTSDTEVVVKVQGFKPENILFLVHEVFESLIHQSYSGVHYDFSIPCMDCQTQSSGEPCMFSASKIRRAVDMKAPFLQCDTAFHILAIPELQAVMPPDRNADFDEHLGRCVRDLRELEEAITISTFFFYSKRNVPSLAEENSVVHPGTIIEDLRTAGIKVSFCDNPETADMENLTLSLKSAQVVMIGMSDEFVENKQCKDLISYTKERLNKPILLILLGSTSNWRNTNLNILLADEVFVKLQDVSRYVSKKAEIVDKLKLKAGNQKTVTEFPKCFISYCWANSQMAKDLNSQSGPGAIGWGDPRRIKSFLESKGITCWIDVERMGTKEGFFEDIAEGLRKAKVMVTCVSDEYADSKNCRMEFRFGLSALRIPVILAVVGTGYKWERTEIGLMAAGNECPKVNLQYDNEAGLLELYAQIHEVLSKSTDDADVKVTASDMRKISFQEVLELAQRKFLRHLDDYASILDRDEFPNLVTIDLADNSIDNVDNADVKEDEFEREISTLMKDKNMDPALQEEQIQKINDRKKLKESERKKEKPTRQSKYCFKLLCEFEKGWHSVSDYISLPDSLGDEELFLKSVAPYCARLFAILKHTSVQLTCLTTPEGEQMRRKLEEWCLNMTPEFQQEYALILKTVMEADTDHKMGGLKKCHMTDGKVLWLCQEHQVLSGSKTTERFKDQLESVAKSEVSQVSTAQTVDTDQTETKDTTDTDKIAPLPATSPKPSVPVHGGRLKRQTSQACAVM